MPLRTRIFILFSLLVLVILAITLTIVLVNKKKSASTANQANSGNGSTGQQVIDASHYSAPTSQSPTVVVNGTAPSLPIKPATNTEILQNGVKQFAKIFIERYGTYSTDGNYQNIKDVQDLVTPTLWKRLSSKISATASTSSAFVGVTTQVVSTKLDSWSDSQAVVTLQTTKITEQNGATVSVQQMVQVSVVKVGNDWLVDSFTWK